MPLKGYNPFLRIDLTLVSLIAILPLTPPLIFLILEKVGQKCVVVYVALILCLLAAVVGITSIHRNDDDLPTIVFLRIRPRLIVTFVL